MEVSIIIPTHNRAEMLKEAINSVLSQTFTDYEVIVISDGSTDETDTVMAQFAARDNRIKYISYKPAVNGGHARNRGILAAKGKYIAFLDDDDTWYSDKLEKQIKIFNNNTEIGLVTTGLVYKYVNEEIEYLSTPNSNGDVSKEILISNCIGGTQVMIRKAILDKTGGFDEALKALQDYELWIRVCQVTNVATVKDPCINYFNYRGSKQISQITKNYEDSFNYISNKHKVSISNLSKSEKKKRKSIFYLLLANKAMRNNEKISAYKYIYKGMITRLSLKGMAFSILALFDYRIVLKARKVLKLN